MFWLVGDWLIFVQVFVPLNNGIAGAMIGVLVPRSGPTNDPEIDICCFSVKHAFLMSKSKW
jgi:hypothetical protein